MSTRCMICSLVDYFVSPIKQSIFQSAVLPINHFGIRAVQINSQYFLINDSTFNGFHNWVFFCNNYNFRICAQRFLSVPFCARHSRPVGVSYPLLASRPLVLTDGSGGLAVALVNADWWTRLALFNSSHALFPFGLHPVLVCWTLARSELRADSLAGWIVPNWNPYSNILWSLCISDLVVNIWYLTSIFYWSLKLALCLEPNVTSRRI